MTESAEGDTRLDDISAVQIGIGTYHLGHEETPNKLETHTISSFGCDGNEVEGCYSP